MEGEKMEIEMTNLNKDEKKKKKKKVGVKEHVPIPMEVVKGNNGLDKIILREVRGSSAEIYLYGAQVTSWKNEHGEELLFVSNKANFQPYTPIRGGIPICFPQFSDLGSTMRHGFVRNRIWSVELDPPPFPIELDASTRAYVDLLLKPTAVDSVIWPHSFEFRLRVTLTPGGDLILTSRIWNTSTEGKPFKFTFAYNSYFSVSDISEIRVEGLETLHYLDNLRNKELFTDQGDALTFEEEVDKIYLDTPSKFAMLDHKKIRTIEIRKSGIPDAVVWNPWEKKAKKMADLGKENYNLMLCLGVAVAENPVKLKPGEEWTGRMELKSVESSYDSGRRDPKKVLLF